MRAFPPLSKSSLVDGGGIVAFFLGFWHAITVCPKTIVSGQPEGIITLTGVHGSSSRLRKCLPMIPGHPVRRVLLQLRHMPLQLRQVVQTHRRHPTRKCGSNACTGHPLAFHSESCRTESSCDEESLRCLAPGRHKILIQLLNANHQPIDQGTVQVTVHAANMEAGVGEPAGRNIFLSTRHRKSGRPD